MKRQTRIKNSNSKDRFFKDSKGNVVITQPPNFPLIAWAVLKVTSLLPWQGDISNGFNLLSSAFLFVWAYLELTAGVNHFRKSLGVLVLGVLTISYFI
ncbi:hypothetical protein CYG49_01675 [Candidatus Saccharibacteria bacterium]|nr:MAG: hypothetical protein CYG49_01675 [Candidatus Saccharibacteria bacterium]